MSDLTINQIKDLKRKAELDILKILQDFQEESATSFIKISIEINSEIGGHYSKRIPVGVRLLVDVQLSELQNGQH